MFKIKENKKIYLGGVNDIFCAIAIFFIPLFSIATSFLIIKDDKSLGAIVLAISMILTSLLMFFVLFWYGKNQFFIWGKFTEKGIEIFIPFSKKYMIEYDKCNHIGFACYFDKGYSPTGGFKYAFIYLSYDGVSKKYKYNINRIKNSKSFVKIKYSPKMYNYLILVLPAKQARMLRMAKLD